MDLRPNLQGQLPPLAEKYIRDLSIQVSQLQGQVQTLDDAGRELANTVEIIRHPTSVLIGGGGGGPSIPPGLGIPPGPTGVSVTHDVFTRDSVIWFYVNYNYTSPTSDPNYLATCIDAMWVDPITGDEVGQRYYRIYEEGQQGPYKSEAYKAFDGGRRKYRFYCRAVWQNLNADTPDDEIPGLVITIGPREPIATGFTGGDGTPPVDATLSNWSIANPSAGAGDYGADANYVQMVRLVPTLISLPADSTYLAYWLDRGVGAGWEFLTYATVPGGIECWREQPKTASTWKVCAISGNDSWYIPPPAGVVYRSLTIAAWIMPTPITGVAISHSWYTIDGTVYFDVTVDYTAPITDPNWFCVSIDVEWVDPDTGADVPGVTKWERVYWERKQGPYTVIKIKAFDGGRRKYRVYNIPIAYSGRFGDTYEQMGFTDGVIVLADREPQATGMSISGMDTTGFGKGITYDPAIGLGGGIRTTAATFLDGKFEHGFKEWKQTVIGAITFITAGFDGNHAMELAPVAGYDVYLYQDIDCNAGQVFRMDAASYRVGIAGSGPVAQITFLDVTGAQCAGGLNVAYYPQVLPMGTTSGWHMDILVWGEAPPTAVKCRLIPTYLPPTVTGGIARVDAVTLGIYEPGSDMVTRDPTTGRLGFAFGSLGKMDRYPSYARPVLNGPTDPTSDTTAIASATNGSYYVNTTSRKIFKRVGSAWTNVEAADVVAGGTFIGNALNLNNTAVGITANVLTASDGSSGPLSGYYGLSVEFNAAGQYKSVVGPDTIWVYNKDFATIPNHNSGIVQNSIACCYGKNASNQICSQLYVFGLQSGGTTTYAYGQVLLKNVNGGNGSSAGYFVDGTRVVRERQNITIGGYTTPAGPYPSSGNITNFTLFDAFFSDANGWCGRIYNEVEQLKTNLANLRNAIQTHGLTN